MWFHLRRPNLIPKNPNIGKIYISVDDATEHVIDTIDVYRPVEVDDSQMAAVHRNDDVDQLQVQ